MSKFNADDRVQFIARRANRVGTGLRPTRLTEGVAYTVESTSYIGVRIGGVWYHESLFELAPISVKPDANKIAKNSVIQVGPEGLRIGTGALSSGMGELVSVRVPPTVDEIRTRWNVDYNYDMNMANQAPEDIKILLDEVGRLGADRDAEFSRAQNIKESLVEQTNKVDEMSGRIMRLQEERNDALSRLSAVEDMLLQWDSTADVSIEDMQAMLMEQVNGE